MAALHQAAACIGAASALLYDWTTLDPTIMHSVRIFEWLSSASVAGTCIARLSDKRPTLLPDVAIAGLPRILPAAQRQR